MNPLFIKAALVVGLVTLGTQVGTTVYMEASVEEDVLAVMSGPATLMAESINRTPPPQRQQAATDLAQRLGYGVVIEPQVRPGPPRSEWRQGELAIVAPLADDSGQVVLGPVPYNDSTVAFIPWVIAAPLALGMLIAVLATLPLVRSIHSLEAVAVRMREGDFSVRSAVEPGDALEGVGRSLNQLADRIGQLLSDERDLMRTVAHEVRAPISRMRFRVEMLQDSVAEPQQRHASGLVGDLGQVDGLFEELLTYVAFDEFDQERPELQTDTFNAFDAARSIVDEIRETAQEREVTLEGDQAATVVANRKLFDRAVANLVRNAVGYSESRVRVVLRNYSRECVIDVQDDGPGIPEADRPRVVKPFVRLDPNNQKTGGTGLGLAIVSRIMRLHRGRLHIVDAPMGGASVQLVWANDRVEARI